MLDKDRVVQKMPLFAGLDKRELKALSAIAEEVSLGSDEVLFEEGSQGDSLYLIVAGEVRITKGGTARKPARTLATLKAGDIFGEIALLLDEPRTATARTVGKCRFYRIPRAKLDMLREKHDPAACHLVYNIARVLCERMRDIGASLVGLARAGERKGAMPAVDLAELRERYFKRGFSM